LSKLQQEKKGSRGKGGISRKRSIFVKKTRSNLKKRRGSLEGTAAHDAGAEGGGRRKQVKGAKRAVPYCRGVGEGQKNLFSAKERMEEKKIEGSKHQNAKEGSSTTITPLRKDHGG